MQVGGWGLWPMVVSIGVGLLCSCVVCVIDACMCLVVVVVVVVAFVSFLGICRCAV